MNQDLQGALSLCVCLTCFMSVSPLCVLYITQISTLILCALLHYLSFQGLQDFHFVCVEIVFCYIYIYFFTALYCRAIVLYGFKGIMGKWWLHFLLLTLLLFGKCIHIYSSSLFTILQLLSVLLIILFSLISLTLQLWNKTSQSLIYYTFLLEAMCVCVWVLVEYFLRQNVSSTQTPLSVSTVLVIMANFLSPPGRIRCLFGHPKQQQTITWCI